MAQRTLKQQKEQKQGDLLNSAYQCFLTKGFAKTTIDDIVRRAQVAKGTFYLYFHDKEDIMKHLVIQISSQIVIRAYTKTKDATSRISCRRSCASSIRSSSISKRIKRC